MIRNAALIVLMLAVGCFVQATLAADKNAESNFSAGRNALTEKNSPLGFKAGHMGYGNPTESAALDFAHQFSEWGRMCGKLGEAGVDQYYPHIPLTECWKSPGEYDFRPLEEQVQRTLKGAPNARFFLRLRVHVPEWWPKLHPDEHILYANRKEGQQDNIDSHWGMKIYPPSLASEVWRRDTEDLLRATMDYILSRDWADRVIGCNPALFHGGEWFEEGSMYKVLADYSPVMQAAFRKWLSAKYPGEKFPEDVVPSPDERMAGDIGHFRDPAKRRLVIDYVDFQSEMIASHIIQCCKAIKEGSKGRFLAGVYYGYTIELAGAGGTAGWMQNSGHLALRQVLNSPYVDYVSTMLEYLHRAPGKFCWAFGPIDAARAHGKFYIAEDEIRTWLDKTDPRILFYILPVPTAEEGINILRRNFATMATHGSLEQVADLGGNWMDDARLLEGVGTLAKLGRQNWARAPVARIALFVDERSFMYQSVKEASPNQALMLDSLVDFFHIGAPLDIFLLSDLTDGLVPLDQYKLCVVPNGFCLTQQQRDYFKNKVQKDNRHILWYYAPGFLTPTKADKQGMFDLTGIRIDYDLTPSAIQIKAGEAQFGTADKISPVFFAKEDEHLDVLGQLRGNDKIGLCRKKMDGWTSIYSAAPGIPAKMLRDFARAAGVHIYAESDDLVHAAGGLVSIHAGVSGDKTIRLPQVCEVSNPFDPAAKSIRTDTLKITLKKGETQMWLTHAVE